MQLDGAKMGSLLGIEIGKHSGCGDGIIRVPNLPPVQQLIAAPPAVKNGNKFKIVIKNRFLCLTEGSGRSQSNVVVKKLTKLHRHQSDVVVWKTLVDYDAQ